MKSPPITIIEPDLDRLHEASTGMASGADGSAIPKLERLANEGSTMSMLYLGDSYSVGRGVAADQALAEDWYRRACDAGSPLACDRLARFLLRNGKSAEGVELLRRLSDVTNYAPALNLLGRLYFAGIGTPKNLELGRLMLERSVASGSIAAAGALGKHYLRSGRSFSERARGARLRLVTALKFFGILVREGAGSPKIRVGTSGRNIVLKERGTGRTVSWPDKNYRRTD
jgi:TPR repeat protein